MVSMVAVPGSWAAEAVANMNAKMVRMRFRKIAPNSCGSVEKPFQIACGRKDPDDFDRFGVCQIDYQIRIDRKEPEGPRGQVRTLMPNRRVVANQVEDFFEPVPNPERGIDAVCCDVIEDFKKVISCRSSQNEPSHRLPVYPGGVVWLRP